MITMIKTVWAFLGTFALTTAAHAVPVTLQVLAPDGKPIIDAEVRTSRRVDSTALVALYDTQAPLREAARTDENGVAHFDWPEPTKYQNLPATTRKYMAQATVWAASFGAINLSLNVGENHVKLPLAGVARGTVRDAKGTPVAGAKVSALAAYYGESNPDLPGMGMFVMAPGEADFTTVSDAQGRWQIGHLPLGSRATVQLLEPKLAANNAIAPIVSADAPMSETPLGAPAAVDQNGNLRALPGAILTGRVLSPQGAPLSDVMVLVTPSRTSFGEIHYKRARTDAQGNYRLERLEAGTYHLSLFTAKNSSLVADPSASGEIALKSGETQKVPDRKLVESGIIEVQISDAISGQPVPNLSVYAQQLANYRATLSFSVGGETDQAGKVMMKVAPGKVRVRLMERLTGYIEPSSNGTGGQMATVVAGKTQRVEWKLARGLKIGGRTVDARGKVVPGVGISYGRIEADGQSHQLTGVMSDEAGKWGAQDFQAGHYELSLYQPVENQSPQWELVAPKTFIVPVRGALDIVVKPLAQIALSGRVVDALGAGVAGAKIDAKITFPEMINGDSVQSAAVSDANGNYTLPAFAATAKSVILNVERDGYVLQSAPEAMQKNAQWSASDAILQALSAHLSGRVVDADNRAQKGVQVLAARSGAVTTSDENGAWKFDNIALDESEIVAVGAAGGSAQSVGAEHDELTLKLRPFVAASPSDIAGASTVLEDAWQTSRGSQFYDREILPRTLAPYDPDVALAIARGGDDRASDRAIVNIVQVLAIKNPELAREWAPQVLAGIEKPESKIKAYLFLAQALAEPYPAEAAVWLEKSIVLYGETDDFYQQRNAAPQIAALSAQLQRPDAQSWFERAIELAAAQKRNSNTYTDLAWQVGAVSADWAAQTIEAAMRDAVDGPRIGNGPETASAAIRRLVRWNLPAAQQLFDKYGEVGDDASDVLEMNRAQAALLIERFRIDHNADVALKEARGLSGMGQRVLVRLAALAPLEQRIEILREALKLARADDFNRSTAISIARQLLPFDRELARQTLDEIAGKFQTYDAKRDYFRSREVAAWAMAYRDIDASRARWELEREWARQRNRNPVAPKDQWMRGSDWQNLVLAMGAVDVARAKQMIFSLPVTEEDGAPFYTARILARWMLASEEERQSRPFEMWEQREEYEDSSLDNW